MSNRTWACVDCGKSYRRPQTVRTVKCSVCGQECESVHWKIHIPSPRKKKEWLEFWTLYRREKRLLDEFQRNPRIKVVTLALLNQRWMRDVPKTPRAWNHARVKRQLPAPVGRNRGPRT